MVGFQQHLGVPPLGVRVPCVVKNPTRVNPTTHVADLFIFPSRCVAVQGASPNVTVALTSAQGAKYASARLEGLTSDWRKFTAELTSSTTDHESRVQVTTRLPAKHCYVCCACTAACCILSQAAFAGCMYVARPSGRVMINHQKEH